MRSIAILRRSAIDPLPTIARTEHEQRKGETTGPSLPHCVRESMCFASAIWNISAQERIPTLIDGRIGDTGTDAPRRHPLDGPAAIRHNAAHMMTGDAAAGRRDEMGAAV